MKKAIFSVFMMTAIAFGGMTYMTYLTTGKVVFPMASWFSKGALANSVDGLKQGAADLVGDAKPATSIYKWQDDSGQWHYSEEAPEDVSSKAVVVDADVNIVAPTPIKKSVTTTSGSSTSEGKVEKVSPYNPVQVRKTIEDAKNIEKLLQERAEQQERLLN